MACWVHSQSALRPRGRFVLYVFAPGMLLPCAARRAAHALIASGSPVDKRQAYRCVESLYSHTGCSGRWVRIEVRAQVFLRRMAPRGVGQTAAHRTASVCTLSHTEYVSIIISNVPERLTVWAERRRATRAGIYSLRDHTLCPTPQHCPPTPPSKPFGSTCGPAAGDRRPGQAYL